MILTKRNRKKGQGQQIRACSQWPLRRNRKRTGGGYLTNAGHGNAVRAGQADGVSAPTIYNLHIFMKAASEQPERL